jgi:hypothetical protein
VGQKVGCASFICRHRYCFIRSLELFEYYLYYVYICFSGSYAGLFDATRRHADASAYRSIWGARIESRRLGARSIRPTADRIE